MSQMNSFRLVDPGWVSRPPFSWLPVLVVMELAIRFHQCPPCHRLLASDPRLFLFVFHAKVQDGSIERHMQNVLVLLQS